MRTTASVTLMRLYKFLIMISICFCTSTFYSSENKLVIFGYALNVMLILGFTIYVCVKHSEFIIRTLEKPSVILFSLLGAAILFIYIRVDVLGDLSINQIILYQTVVYGSEEMNGTGAQLIKLVCNVLLYLGYFNIVLLGLTFVRTYRFAENSEHYKIFNCIEINYKALAILFGIAMMPYLIIWWPGTIASDTTRQLAEYYQVAGLVTTNKFPYILSVVYDICYKFGLLIDSSGVIGIFMMTIFQLVLVYFCMSTIIVWLVRLNSPSWLVHLSIIFYCLFPLIPIYVVSIIKDGLHAWLLALLVLQIYLYILNKKGTLEKHFLFNPINIWLVSLAVCLTRNNGIYLVFPTLFFLVVLFREKKNVILLIGLLLSYALYNQLQFNVLGIHNEGMVEAYSIPAQIIAANAQKGYIKSPEDNLFIANNVDISLEQIAATYNPRNSDPIRRHILIGSAGNTATLSELLHFTWHLIKEHPNTSISAVIQTTQALNPVTRGTYWPEDAPYFADTSFEYNNSTWFVDQSYFGRRNTEFSSASSILQQVHSLPLLNYFYTPGFYVWILMTIIFLLSINKKGREYIIALLPLFVLVAVLMAAPVGSIRYALPMVYSLPIILMIFVSAQKQCQK